MTIYNAEIAAKFYKLADLLEIEGANPFRVRAYRTAGRVIDGLTKNVSELIKAGEDLTELPGIGNDLAEKIKLIVKTGELKLLQDIEARLPSILGELMSIEGLGPKRIQILYKKLRIKNLEDLESAIAKGRVKKLHGFGEKTEQRILQGISHLGEQGERIKLVDAFPIVNSLIDHLKNYKDTLQIDCAGSVRRYKETIGDLDILVSAKNGKKVIDHFVKYDEVQKVISQGTTRASLKLHSGIKVDLRVIPKESYGAALLYFTGSKDHNIAIRKIGVQKKLKINEYGVYKNNRRIAGATEEEVYRAVGLPFIPPELREERGEISAAKNNCIPALITLEDIRGDLHCHTVATDGIDTLSAMANKAQALGYEYLAITDHSKRLAFTHGLDKNALLAQMNLIDKINNKFKKIVLLKAIEVDILEDGTFDLPNNVLKELDIVVGALHSKFNLTKKQQTERILRAMENTNLHILAHPTGRLINRRAPYPLDMERIMQAAKAHSVALELNAQPDRLDLNDVHCKMAKDMGVRLAISTDAHSTSQLSNMRYGIYQARRGWLSKSDVINALSLADLRKLLQR